MIPRIIHYCWFGGNAIPDNLRRYMATWRTMMPDWKIIEWNEQNFSIENAPLYVQEAYREQKWAFVSDYVRLWALNQYGGIYFDTDIEVLRPFDNLLNNIAFIGLEESLAHLPGTCVMGCEPQCIWVKEMLALYNDICFVRANGTYDMTTNVQRMGEKLVEKGFVPCRKEQFMSVYGLRIYTHDYFSPITSTRVMRKTAHTYCIHHFAGSWTNNKHYRLRDTWLVRELINALIQIKRKLKGIN